MSSTQIVPVVKYFIGDCDENIYEADNPQSFDETNKLLQKLRLESPEVIYTMYAEIDT